MTLSTNHKHNIVIIAVLGISLSLGITVILVILDGDNIIFQDLEGQSQTENLDIDSIINEIGE